MVVLVLPSDKNCLLYSEEVLQNEAKECGELSFLICMELWLSYGKVQTFKVVFRSSICTLTPSVGGNLCIICYHQDVLNHFL